MWRFAGTTQFFGALALWATVNTAMAQDSLPVAIPELDRPVSFHEDVLPFLKAKCLACHSASEAESDLVLESPETIRQGAFSGPVLVEGSADESPLFLAATHRGEFVMPPEANAVGAKNLTPEELGLLKLWIDEGAVSGDALAATPLEWRRLPEDMAPINAVALTADGRYVAAGWANRLFIYQLDTQRLVAELIDPSLGAQLVTTASPRAAAHLDLIQSLDFSPDGQRLASGGFRTVKIWRRAAPILVRESRDSAEEPAAVSPVGDLEVKWNDKIVELRNTATGQVVQSFDLGRPVEHAVLSPDGARLIVLGSEGPGQLFNATNGELISELKGRLREHDRVASAARMVRIRERQREHAQSDVDVATKQRQETDESVKQAQTEIESAQTMLAEKRKAEEEKINARDAAVEKLAELERDLVSKQESLVQSDQAIQEAAEAASDELRQAKEAAQEAVEATMAAVEESKKVVEQTTSEAQTAGSEREAAQRSVEAAQDALARNQPLAERAAHELCTAEAALEQAKQSVATANADHEQLQQQAAMDGSTLLVAGFSPDVREIAAVDSDGRLITFSATTGATLEEIEIGDEPPMTVEYSHPQEVRVTTESNVYEVHTLPTWQLERTLGSLDDPLTLVERVTALDFSPSGELLAAGSGEPSRSGQIDVFEIENGSVVAELDEAHSDTVLSVAFSADELRIASSSADRFAKVFNLASGTVEKTLEGHTGHVLSVAWHPDGRLLATASADMTLKIWDAQRGEQRKTIEGFGTALNGVTFLGLEDQCVVAGGGGLVRSHNTDGSGGPSYGGAADVVHSVSSSANGSFVAAGGQDGWLRVWTRDGQEVAKLAPRERTAPPAPE